MMDDGEKLLAAVEALMAEVRGLRADLVSRDSRETAETAELKEKAAALDGLRSRASARRKRNRADKASRDSRETEPKQAEIQNTMSRDSRATAVVVKAVAFVGDQDQLQKETRSQQTATVARQEAAVPVTRATWQAYSKAYHAKYNSKPVWNATVAGQLAHLVRRLGGDEAPGVAAFYVQHAGAYYAKKGHAVGPLLADAEKLRTEWATGRQITGIGTRLDERTQHNADVFTPLLKGKEHGVA